MNRPNFSPAHNFSLADALPDHLDHFEPLLSFQIAFAPEPIFHRSLQPIERHTISRFQNAVGDRKSIIKDRVIREISHGKIVDLADRAGVARARSVDSVHGDSPRKHGFTVNEGAAERGV
jgi:hypothetical protein